MSSKLSSDQILRDFPKKLTRSAICRTQWQSTLEEIQRLEELKHRYIKHTPALFQLTYEAAKIRHENSEKALQDAYMEADSTWKHLLWSLESILSHKSSDDPPCNPSELEIETKGIEKVAYGTSIEPVPTEKLKTAEIVTKMENMETSLKELTGHYHDLLKQFQCLSSEYQTLLSVIELNETKFTSSQKTITALETIVGWVTAQGAMPFHSGQGKV